MLVILGPVLCAGLAVVLLARYAVSPSRMLGLNVLASLLALVGFVLLPAQAAMAFDQRVGVTGLGYLVARLAFTAGATLHGVAVRMGLGSWTRRTRRRLLPGLVLFMSLFVGCWVLTSLSHAADLQHRFYDGYGGHPATVFWMSVTRGVSIIWYSVFVLHAYVLVMRQEGRRPVLGRLCSPAFLICCGFAANAFLGVIAIVEACLDSLTNERLLADWYFTALTLAIASLVVVYVLYTMVEPLADWYRELRAAPRLLVEVQRCRDEMRYYFNRVLEHDLAFVPYADPAVMAIARRVCEEEGLLGDDRDVLLGAAREMTLHPDHIEALQQAGSDEVDAGVLAYPRPAALAAEYFAVQSQESDFAFLIDRALVAALACGADPTAVSRMRVVEERHRRLAGMLRTVFARYEQPARYLEEYRRDLEQRALERDAVRAGFGQASETWTTVA